MKFPELLSLAIREKSTSIAIERVAFVLTLFAERKNNFHIGPEISIQNGKLDFSRDQCARSIERDKKLFPMDYCGTLEDCRPFVEIKLLLPNQIKNMMTQYKKHPNLWGQSFDNPSRLFEQLDGVRNSEYCEKIVRLSETDLLAESEIVIYLSKSEATNDSKK